jgi:hypothetical protein
MNVINRLYEYEKFYLINNFNFTTNHINHKSFLERTIIDF